jgi:hypothetical protein
MFPKIASASSIILFNWAVAKLLYIWIHISWMVFHYKIYFTKQNHGSKNTELDKMYASMVVMVRKI